MRPSTKTIVAWAAMAFVVAGAILLPGPIAARLRMARKNPYGLTPAQKLEVSVPDSTKRSTPIYPGSSDAPPVLIPPEDIVEAVTVRKYDPPYDVVKPLWKSPAERKFGSPEDAHFSALSSKTREELLECFTESAQKRLLAADARQGGKLLLTASEEIPWPPDPFTRYLYRVDFHRGDTRYALIKVRPIFVKNPPPQDDPNGVYEFVFTFVETPRGWLRTFELDTDPLLQLVQKCSFEQFLAHRRPPDE